MCAAFSLGVRYVPDPRFTTALLRSSMKRTFDGQAEREAEEEKDRMADVRYTSEGSASEVAIYIKIWFNENDTKRCEMKVRFL